MEGTVKLNSKSVAWYWVIEYFSTLKQIDASILRGLIELVPEIHDEELGAKTREAVALRCLEELFDPLPDPATVDAQANGHFDFSRSCEEVLTYVRQRASISELKSGAPEPLKSRVIPFIIHKRATMGQTALSKLKDELVRGTHPFAASLSKGSGLVLANLHDKVDVLALSRRSPTEANVDAQVSEVQEHLVDTNLDNVDAQVHEVQESLIATTLDNVEGNADAQVPEVQESLIATTLDNVEGNADAQVPEVQGSLIATTVDNVEGNADAQVSVVQESLIATTHDNMDADADVQVSEVQEIHNSDAQVFAVQESLIATTGGNVVGNADAQVAKPQEADNAYAQVFMVRQSLIATIHDNVDGNDDVQVSKAQEIHDAVLDGSMVQETLFATIHGNVDGNADVQVSEAQEIDNADAPVSVVQEGLIATTHDNLDGNANTQVSKAQQCLFYTSFDDANVNTDAEVAEAQVSLIATTIENLDGDADAQVSKAQEKLICTTLDDAIGKSDAQVAKAQESLIATILNNVDGTASPQVSKAQESLMYTTHDDANGNADSQAVEAHISLIPTILENMDGVQRHDMHAEEFFPLKRKSNDSPDKYVDGQAYEIENLDDLDGRHDHYLVSKKFRLDPFCGNQSVVQTLVPLHDNADEFVQENSSQIVAEASKEVRKYSKLGGLEESPSLVTAYNDKVSRGAAGNGSHDYLSVVGVVSCADLRSSSVVPALKTHNVDEGRIKTDSNVHENEPVDTMKHLSKDTEFDNDGYDNERLKISEIEGNIFNSPCKVNHGSSQMSESPVLNLCVKCNKEGSLFVCSSINCPLGFHESCLGSPVKFDDEGCFYCPFCAYSRALSEYRKCMESFSSAKQELYSFFNTNAIHQPKEVANKLYRTKHHHPR